MRRPAVYVCPSDFLEDEYDDPFEIECEVGRKVGSYDNAIANALMALKNDFSDVKFIGHILYDWSDDESGDTVEYELVSGDDIHFDNEFYKSAGKYIDEQLQDTLQDDKEIAYKTLKEIVKEYQNGNTDDVFCKKILKTLLPCAPYVSKKRIKLFSRTLEVV